ncbi:hypothetical protein [Capnocytophaga sp.]|uniref:hypothetical protein n=1 Tax=Capnocytophaga sp. TaxID=44737 RepID=UPI0026DD8EDA|nr:hypothetical protein [Capnocytophaga sp.]MDO5105261.1 hypothetical protein [Capnocytophaga sp.]
MKKHLFLKLKMGIIEQYAMVVKKKELKHWESLGWRTFMEIGLPEGDDEAYLLYGKIRRGETLVFNRPKLLKDTPFDTIIGLTIKGFCTHLGTYGMGGPGFFGLHLSNGEYLTYAVWGADDYVLVDDRVVACNPNLYHKTKPWVSNFGGDNNWDELTEYISESKIVDVVLNDDVCRLILQKEKRTMTLEFVRNDRRLPRKTGRKRNAYSKGTIGDYLLFQHENATLIV